VVVHSEHQKKGIGSILLQNVVEKIRGMKIEKVILACERKNSSFYEKFAEQHSFTHSKETIGTFQSGEDIIQITINI